jgi:hypothetical protein
MTADGEQYAQTVFRLVRCAACGRGGLAKIHDQGNIDTGKLAEFHPGSIERAALPAGVPSSVAAEYQEAEVCAGAGAWRGASALLRSALEKALEANGYRGKPLAGRIDDAAADGVITAARQRRAHDDVRSLGNDILHDEWREVTPEEYESAHHYVLRVLEDLYDTRAEVEALLVEKGRIEAPSAEADGDA